MNMFKTKREIYKDEVQKTRDGIHISDADGCSRDRHCCMHTYVYVASCRCCGNGKHWACGPHGWCYSNTSVNAFAATMFLLFGSLLLTCATDIAMFSLGVIL